MEREIVAARDVNLLSAEDMSRQSGSNSGSNASIGAGLNVGGQQNGFTLELAASGTRGHMNGNGMTNVDTRIDASDALIIASGRDTNLNGAQAAGSTVNVDVGRNLTITSPQDTNAYDSRQTSAGMQASICVPPNGDMELIKVVPKGTFGGDSVSAYSPYFMTKAEYDSLSKLPADQIAARLGLPAEQAVRGSQLGFDVYSMKPLPGTSPQAFTSQIAPVQQGAYSVPGGAQQVLIPNRNQWTDPNANKIGELRGR